MDKQHIPISNARRGTLSFRKRLIFSLTPAFALALVLFASAEIVLRAHYASTAAITGAAEWTISTWHGLTFYWDQYHPLYGWTNLPQYRSDARVPFHVSINSQGIRADHDYAPRAAPNVRRIVVLGDSCTFGEEVNDDETMPYYLQRHLKNAEVLNLGVHGYGVGQMALRLEQEGFAFHPDLVLLVILLPTDMVRDSVSEFVHSKPVFYLDGGILKVSNIPVPEASHQPWLYQRCFIAAWLFARAKSMPEPPSGMDARLALTQAILLRIGKTADAHGVPVISVLMIVPGSIEAEAHDSLEAARNRYMRNSLRGLGMDVLDACGFLTQAWGRQGKALAAPIAHWSASGNCLLAGYIAEYLASKKGWALASNRPS